MKITDRPGRYFAIFIFSPTLFVCGIINMRCSIYTSYILIVFSIGLFCYESYWISFRPEEIGYKVVPTEIVPI